MKQMPDYVKRYYLKSSSSYLSYYYLKVSSIYLFIIGPNYKYIYLYLTTNTKHFYPVILACEYMRKTHNKLDRKEANVLFNNALQHILFTVIWRQTYGKGPLR